jgi:hypothetical protein
MKSQILTFILILFSVKAFSQEQGNITGKFYITNIDIVVEEFNLTKNETTINKFIAKKSTKFTAYEIKNNKLLVKFWNYSGNNQSQPKESIIEGYKYISNETNDKYFLIDLADFNNKTSEYYGSNHSFVWGFSLLPIKLRFGDANRPFNYETGFSLGTNAGYEYQIKSRVKQSVGLLFGIGISTVGITPETVNNYIDKTTTVGALTPSLGLVYSYENFQIGVFSGYDIIPGELGKNWQYRNSPWLGLGLGFTIFQRNKTANSSNQTQ